MAEAMNVSLPIGFSSLNWNNETKLAVATQSPSAVVTTTISPTCQIGSPIKTGNNFATPSLAAQLSAAMVAGRFIVNKYILIIYLKLIFFSRILQHQIFLVRLTQTQQRFHLMRFQQRVH